MKKTRLSIVAIALALLLCGCGERAAEAPAAEPTAAPETVNAEEQARASEEEAFREYLAGEWVEMTSCTRDHAFTLTFEADGRASVDMDAELESNQAVTDQFPTDHYEWELWDDGISLNYEGAQGRTYGVPLTRYEKNGITAFM